MSSEVTVAIEGISRVVHALHERDGQVDTQDLTQELESLREEMHRLNESLELRVLEAQKMAQLTADINQGVLLEDVLNHVYDSFRSIVPYNRIGFALICDDGQRARAVWARSESQNVQISSGYSAPLSSSLRTILDTEQPRVINDLEAHYAANPGSESSRRMLAEGIRSSLTCPLLVERRPVGFLFFSSALPNTYSKLHQQTFLQVARQLASIVDKSRLFEKLMEAKEELEQVNAELRRLVTLDGLTRVPNRRAFDEGLERAWAHSRTSETPLSIVMIDIDYFKRYNDSLGHAEGDECLKRVARALDASLTNHTLARYGGEEFVALLPDTHATEAQRLASQLQGAVRALKLTHPASEVGPHVSISLGVSTGYATSTQDPMTLVATADAALYNAKRAGRDQASFLPHATDHATPVTSAA